MCAFLAHLFSVDFVTDSFSAFYEKGMLVGPLYGEDMNYMFFKIYILATLRLMLSKWWLSLIKVFSLTSGILSFLLVWLFYIDHHHSFGMHEQFLKNCSVENLLILGFILLITTIIYFFIMRSQIQLRHKELFFRKYYGETYIGIISILLIETSIFIVVSFLLSLVLIDQVAPVFNLITEKSINLQEGAKTLDLLLVFCFLSVLGFVIGIVPSLWYAKNRAIDILKKLPR